MSSGCRSANGVDEPLLAAEAGEDPLKLPPSVLVKSAMPAHDEDSDDDTPHVLAAAQPAAPRRGLLRRVVGFFDSQGGATVCSIWLCLILKVVQQARIPLGFGASPRVSSTLCIRGLKRRQRVLPTWFTVFAQDTAVHVCSPAA